MAMSLVCDVCNKPVKLGACVRGNGDFDVTANGIYLSGDFRVELNGEGKDADVCFDCVRKILMMTDVNVRDGVKAAPDVEVPR